MDKRVPRQSEGFGLHLTPVRREKSGKEVKEVKEVKEIRKEEPKKAEPAPLLTNLDFGNSFDATLMVEKITENMLRFNKKQNQEFDAKAMQEIFSAAVKQIEILKGDTEKQIQSLVEFTKEAEDEHKGKMVELEGNLSDITADFKKLDKRISKVATTAVRIGDNLDTVDSQRERCVKGKEIISYFLEFNNGIVNPFFTDPKRIHEAALVLQNLQAATPDLQIKGVEKAIELISVKSTELENRILDQFMVANMRENIDAMKTCVNSLLNFRSTTFVKKYIANAIGPVGRDYKSVKHSVSDFSAEISSLYKDILGICKREIRLIHMVFPQPDRITKLLLEMVFDEKIIPFINIDLLVKGRTIEEYVLILEVSYDKTAELVDMLDEVVKSHTISAYGSSQKPDSLQADASNTSASALVAALKLREKSFNRHHVNLAELLDGVLGRYREQYIVNEEKLLLDFVSTEIKQALSVFDSKSSQERDFFGRRKSSAVEELRRNILNVLDSDIVDRMLQCAVKALRRCAKLTDATTQPQYVHRIFSALLQQCCLNFIVPVVNLCSEFVPEPTSLSEPDFFFYSIGQYVNDIAQKIDLHFSEIVMPRMEFSPNVQSACVAEKRDLFARIETNLLNGYKVLLQVSCNYIKSKLKELQVVSDYRPRDDTDIPEESTRACEVVSNFVNRHLKVWLKSFDGHNLDLFLTCFGKSWFDILIEHFKQYNYNSNGALTYLRDIRTYQDVIRDFNLPILTEAFENLRSIANFFIVSPENLSTLIQKDIRLSKMDEKEVKEFIKLRTDYKSSFLQKFMI